MSLTTYFLKKSAIDHSTLKYFNTLLSYPIPRLVKEQEANLLELQTLNKQMKLQALTESKEFIEALGDGKEIQMLENTISSFLNSALEQTTELEKSLQSNWQKLEENLQEQKKLRMVSSQQGIISEILDVPALLKTLINAHHYNEALELLKFVENLKDNYKCGIFAGLWNTILELKHRIEDDVIDQLTDTLDKDKTFNYLLILKHLKNLDENQLCESYIRYKKKYLAKKLSKQNTPKLYILFYLNTIKDFLPSFTEIFYINFKDHDLLFKRFCFDLILMSVEDLSRNFSQLDLISDIREISSLWLEINRDIFLPLGANISKEISNAIISSTQLRFLEMCQKTLTHFETMVKLFMWESTAQKENPLLEYGSISVLYNNCITIISEIRELPLEELKETFYTEIGLLLKKTAEYSMQKGSHLLPEAQLTRQQKIYRGLFIGFINCLRNHLYPEIIKHALETYDNSEQWEQTLNDIYSILSSPLNS
ncbi:unnamed protein product [Blepharisma stoltei]|uniref:Conserved oligomeric Golgi complex subunit 8 n=1 Tax=Blepharisma stoltei TaxID=1481888 RepID=A0AAU9KBI3_9CILI|nr:unnamed protein product [Blepharisma stoltei]